jgi:hypothetical protein
MLFEWIASSEIEVTDGGRTNLKMPVFLKALFEITWSVFGSFTTVTFVAPLKVPLSVVMPEEDKSTDPEQPTFVVEIAEST